MLYVLLVLLASAIAAVTDLRTRRIFNAVPAGLAAAGLSLHALQNPHGLAICIALLIAVFLSGTLLFSLGIIGGGDVKLLAAAAATLGWPLTMPFLLYTIFAGALLGIGIACARGQLRATFSNIFAMTVPMAAGGRPSLTVSAAGSMPYGVAIFSGVCTLALVQQFGLH
ncbi:MAG TPA: prepilin peptidase [Candidatus Baltobacteraceae bacterium]|nr:prepilin peptidase [Candidatus Baltobacteraceae bacterium]